jgi:hypothetical protein
LLIEYGTMSEKPKIHVARFSGGVRSVGADLFSWDAGRPYRVAGYPFVPALYMVGAAVVLVMLFVYRPATTWPGLAIVIVGAGVYALLPRVDASPPRRHHCGGTPPIALP